MSTSVVRNATLMVKGDIENITVRFVDANGDPVDPTALTLRVYNQSETTIIYDDLTSGYGETPALPTHIENPEVGTYSFPFGDDSFDTANTSATTGSYLFRWKATIDGEQQTFIQVIKVCTVSSLLIVQQFALILDKIQLAVDEDPADPLYLGYTDSMLYQFLEDGLSFVNAFQPATALWTSVDAFPKAHLRILMDAALCAALISQELLAVAIDVNYSDQGDSFVIEHQPKLSAILTSTWTRLKEMTPPMKRQYWQGGSARIEFGTSSRFQQLLSSSPAGALFRNGFMSG